MNFNCFENGGTCGARYSEKKMTARLRSGVSYDIFTIGVDFLQYIARMHAGNVCFCTFCHLLLFYCQ